MYLTPDTAKAVLQRAESDIYWLAGLQDTARTEAQRAAQLAARHADWPEAHPEFARSLLTEDLGRLDVWGSGYVTAIIARVVDGTLTPRQALFAVNEAVKSAGEMCAAHRVAERPYPCPHPHPAVRYYSGLLEGLATVRDYLLSCGIDEPLYATRDAAREMIIGGAV